MTALSVFRFDGADVRTVVIDGEPWFVAADVAAILGYREAHDLTRTLDDDEKGPHPVRTPGGEQYLVVISEAGLFKAIVQRQSGRISDPAARAAVKTFQRWITHEVLPSIRRTGSYVTPETPEQLLARALVTAQSVIERKDEQIAVLAPRAEAWDELAELRWIHRGSHGKWKAYQSAVDAGYLAERPQSHHHPRTGELILDPPQVRVTIRGLERLRVRLGVLKAVESA